jgi:cytoskeletal protein CcmA (bactofilin family)
MWKKTTATEDVRESTESATPARVPSSAATSPKPARIGSSLSFKGELYGEEDLLIEGRVEGRIVIKKGGVTIGEKGRVEADIEATSIHVAGSVKGDLSGADRVVLLETGRLEGNIKAKSVTLENGCRFRGSIDMESDAASAKKDASSSLGTKSLAPSTVARTGV